LDNFDYERYVGFNFKGREKGDVHKDILKDTRGRKRTRTLFLEAIDWTRLQKGYEPLYSLCYEGKKGLPSAYEIYINSRTEEEAALKLVGSMPHWRTLLKCPWFLLGDEKVPGFEGLEVWRQDLQALKKAEAMDMLHKEARKGNVAAIKELKNEANKSITTHKARTRKKVVDPRSKILNNVSPIRKA